MNSIYKKTYRFLSLIIFVAFFNLLHFTSFAIDLQFSKLDANKTKQEIAELQTREIAGKTYYEVSLNKLISYYLALSRDVKLSYFGVKTQEELARSASGVYTPRLSLEGSQSRSMPSYSTSTTATQTANSERSATFKQQTPWGISYYLKYTYDKTASRSLTLNDDYSLKNPTITEAASVHKNNATLGLHLPLFQNFGSNGSIASDKAIAQARIAGLNSRASIDDQILGTISVYLNLKYLFQRVDILTTQVALSQKLYDESARKVELGLQTVNTKLQLQYRLLQNQSDLQVAQNQIQSVNDTIKNALEIPELDYNFYPSEDLELTPLDLAADELKQRLLEESNDLKRIRINREIAALDKKSANNLRRWKFDFDGTYSIYGASLEKSDAELRNEKDVNGYSAALTLEIPLGDGGGFAASRASEYQLAYYDLQIENSLSNIDLLSKSIVRDLETSKQIAAAQQISTTASDNLQKLELVKFNLGQSTAADLDLARQNYLTSALNLTQAQIQYLNTYYQALINSGNMDKKFPEVANILKEFDQDK